MEVTVEDRQSMADLAIQTLGGVDGLFALAARNGLGITAQLTDGMVLEWDYADTVNPAVQRAYAERGIRPATDLDRGKTNGRDEYGRLMYSTAPGLNIILPDWDDKPVIKPDIDTDRLGSIIADLEAGKPVVPVHKAPQLTGSFTEPFDTMFD